MRFNNCNYSKENVFNGINKFDRMTGRNAVVGARALKT